VLIWRCERQGIRSLGTGYLAYSPRPRGIRYYLRSRWKRQSVAQLALVKAVDTNDEAVLAERWQWQARKVGSKTNMLIIGEADGGRSADVEHELHLQRACRVGSGRQLHDVPVRIDKFNLNLVLLVRLLPWNGDHDPDSDVDQVRRVRTRLNEPGVDTASGYVQHVVHGFGVVAKDGI
jgi:hypothetical protein